MTTAGCNTKKQKYETLVQPLLLMPFLHAVSLEDTSAGRHFPSCFLEELAEPEPLQQSALFFNITEAQFPKIPEEHEPVTVEYGYVNRSDKPLTINKVTAFPAGCIAVNYDKARLFPAGGKGTIKVSFQAQRLFRTLSTVRYSSIRPCRPIVPP